MNFYGWLWFLFALMSVLLIASGIKAKKLAITKKTADRAQRIIMNLAGYPLAVLIAWAPVTVTGMIWGGLVQKKILSLFVNASCISFQIRSNITTWVIPTKILHK